VVIPPDLVEVLWDLWQAAPYLCTITVPVLLARSPPVICRGLRSLERWMQWEHFVGRGSKVVANNRKLKPSGADRVRHLGLRPLVAVCKLPFSKLVAWCRMHSVKRCGE
jgi:hypothetical protein